MLHAVAVAVEEGEDSLWFPAHQQSLRATENWLSSLKPSVHRHSSCKALIDPAEMPPATSARVAERELSRLSWLRCLVLSACHTVAG